jgi:hypothetical protein
MANHSIQGVGNVPESNWQYVSPSEIADTDDDEVAPAVTGKRNHVSGLSLSNTDAAVATYVVLKSGSTVIWKGHLAPYIAAAPGAHIRDVTFAKPLEGGVGEAINVACLTTSAQVTACVQGFVAQ